MSEITQQDVAEKLLFPIFRCITADYKSRYKTTIWDQFHGQVRQAAYTSSLSKFLQGITNQMPVHLERQYMDDIQQIVASGLDKSILNWMREETTYMVMLARMCNEKRKEEIKRNMDLNKELFDNDLP